MSAVKRSTAWLVRSLREVLEREGPTHACAFLRIGLALNVWACWSRRLLLFEQLTLPRAAIALAFFVCSTAFLLGWHTRIAAFGLALVASAIYYYMGGTLHIDAFHHHHTYILVMGLWFVALTPCGRSLSLDRWFALRRAERTGTPPPPEWGPLWAMHLIALQVTVVYLGSAFDKSHEGFLRGVRHEHLLHFLYLGSDTLPQSPLVTFVLLAMGTGTVILEYALAIGLWVPRLRAPLIVVGLAFHGVLYVLLPLSTFSTTMAVLYLAYLPAETVTKVWTRLTAPTLAVAE